MSEIWYETSGWGERIRPVEVERHTDTSVWIDGNRRAKVTRYNSIFPTWAEAHQHLLDDAQERLDSARRNLQLAQSHYGNIKGMKEPHQ